MAFTNSWDETAPAGTDAISSGDDEIRQFKLDIRERLNSILSSAAALTNNIDPLTLAESLTQGDGAEEDITYIFNGNAQQYHIGLDDSADHLIIGLGSTIGTTPVIHINSDQDVLIAAAAATVDGQLHVIADATDKIALVAEVPTSSSVKAMAIHYNGTGLVLTTLSSSETLFDLFSRDTGSDVAGPSIRIGRNTNSGNPNAGTLQLTKFNGTQYYLWVDANNSLRIHTAPPGASGNDLDGTVVGAQTAP